MIRVSSGTGWCQNGLTDLEDGKAFGCVRALQEQSVFALPIPFLSLRPYRLSPTFDQTDVDKLLILL